MGGGGFVSPFIINDIFPVKTRILLEFFADWGQKKVFPDANKHDIGKSNLLNVAYIVVYSVEATLENTKLAIPE